MDPVQNVPAFTELSPRVEIDQIFVEVDALFGKEPISYEHVRIGHKISIAAQKGCQHHHLNAYVEGDNHSDTGGDIFYICLKC